jgi:hypothetical protein
MINRSGACLGWHLTTTRWSRRSWPSTVSVNDPTVPTSMGAFVSRRQPDGLQLEHAHLEIAREHAHHPHRSRVVPSAAAFLGGAKSRGTVVSADCNYVQAKKVAHPRLERQRSTVDDTDTQPQHQDRRRETEQTSVRHALPAHGSTPAAHIRGALHHNIPFTRRVPSG